MWPRTGFLPCLRVGNVPRQLPLRLARNRKGLVDAQTKQQLRAYRKTRGGTVGWGGDWRGALQGTGTRRMG
jgi:hypothetical protein